MKDRERYVENEMKTKSPFQFVKSAIKMLLAQHYSPHWYCYDTM